MDILFFLLTLLSLVAVPVVLIKPSIIKMNSRLKASAVTGGATLLFFTLFLIALPEVETGTVDADKEEVQEEVTDVEEEPEEPEEEPVEDETSDKDPTEESEPEKEEEEDDLTWDDLKDKDKIVGKSDKDFTDISNSKPTDVRNDSTGNWKKTTTSENIDIEEYALSYHDTHMQADEVHHIINFTRNTTTWLSEMGGLLYVDIKEYVEKEEHDANTLGSGMLLKSYVIYPDGDIEEIE